MKREWMTKEDAKHLFPDTHKFPFFCCAGWRNRENNTGAGFWFRIFWGYGMHFTNGPKSFSERYGYERRIPLGLKWRTKFIKRSGY